MTKPLPEGVRSVSAQRMGEAESVKAALGSTVRKTVDGREWIWTGKLWVNLDAIEREATDYNDFMFFWR